jgi:hypothetical protein
MRRILLVLSAAALIATITAFSSVSAFAQEPVCTDTHPGEGDTGDWTRTCELGTEVRSEEVSRTPATEDCVVDNPGRGTSGRPGTREGEEVRTDEVTYRIYTTQLFQGNPVNGIEIDEEPIPHEEEVPGSRIEGEPTFEPTGPCQPIHGPAQPS